MKKSQKRIWCGALVCVMAATTIFSTSPTTKAETIEIVKDATQNNAATLTIHAKGSGLRLYAWNAEGKAVTGEWIEGMPGDAMTDEGNGWCYISLNQEIKGLLICDASGNKLTPDVTDKTSGEWWFDGSTWSNTDSTGGSDATPTPSGSTTPTDSPIVTVTEKPELTGEITIHSITPANNSVLEAGVAQTITVDADSTIGDGVLYYKFEVSCDGEFVGEHYYSKNQTTYTFTPEAGKTYTAIIYVQAHDEDNTFEKIMYTYKTSGDQVGDSTPSPIKTPEPGSPTIIPGGSTSTPTAKPTSTPTAKPTATSTAGTGTIAPTISPSGEDSNGNATLGPNETLAPGTTQIPLGEVLDVTFSISKASNLTLGKSVELAASASNGVGTYTYRFRAKKSTATQAEIIQDFSESATCIWTPSAKGTYTLYVDVKDESGTTAVTKTITKYKVNGLTLSVSTNKKSPQKKKTRIKITAKTTYRCGTAKYRFVIKLKGKKVKTRAYKTKRTCIWKPKKKGTYTIFVYAKDSKSTVLKKKKFRIKIK